MGEWTFESVRTKSDFNCTLPCRQCRSFQFLTSCKPLWLYEKQNYDEFIRLLRRLPVDFSALITWPTFLHVMFQRPTSRNFLTSCFQSVYSAKRVNHLNSKEKIVNFTVISPKRLIRKFLLETFCGNWQALVRYGRAWQRPWPCYVQNAIKLCLISLPTYDRLTPPSLSLRD